jgi:hypothetical protein
VNFLKADSYAQPRLPADYGWPQLEATHNSTVSGAPHTTTNPFTGVLSYYPIREFGRGFGGAAAIGGYVYRGPIAELQGRYFYADFVASRLWMLDFDRNTDPTAFNGTNGIVTDLRFLWNLLVVDPSDANYRGDTNITTLNGLDHIVSFGEDNDGNLYLVDFGYGSGFEGQYRAGAGEIFKVVPGPVPPPELNWTHSATHVLFFWSGTLFKLQAQTNAPTEGLNAIWNDYPGGLNSPVSVPISGTNGAVLFRLKSK